MILLNLDIKPSEIDYAILRINSIPSYFKEKDLDDNDYIIT